MEKEKNIEVWNKQIEEGGYYYLDKNNKTRVFIEEHLTDLGTTIFPYENLKGKKVLDIGCGIGNYTKELSKYATEIVGIDPADKAIEYAKKHYSAPNLKFVVGDVYNIPFKDKYFDVVIVRALLHHLYYPNKALIELGRVSKVMLISESNGINPYRQIVMRLSKGYKEVEEGAIPPKKLAKYINQAGFKIDKEIYGTFVPPISPDWMLPFFKKLEAFIEKTFLIKYVGGTYVVLISENV